MGVFTVVLSIKDAKNQVSTTEINIPDTVSVADAKAYAQEVAKLVDPLITGAIVRIGVVLGVDLPGGLSATPDAGADVEEGARFQFRTAGGFFTSCRLATFDEAKISAGTRSVNTADAAVTAFVNGITSGIDVDPGVGVNNIMAQDKRGDDIVSLEFAREQFLSSRG
jgi:hypothetical protein